MQQIKNIINVSITNVISFGTSFIIGFILPAILSVQDYGYYREFVLYSSFAYLLNFGYNDGIYIKYGGKSKNQINYSVLNSERLFINIFQLIIFIIMITFSQVFKKEQLFYFSFVVLSMSLVTFHQNFLQAIGEFKSYSTIYIARSFLYIIGLIFYIYVLRIKNYTNYIWLYIISFFVLYFIYEINFTRRFKAKHGNILSGQTILFRSGIFVLIANMSLTFVGNIGNWIINARYSIDFFAQYSFQNSLLNVILLIVNAIGMVFFNLFAKNINFKVIKLVKKLCIFLGIIMGLGFFIFKIIIINYLPQYTFSISLLSITFIAIPYIMMSKIIFANLYKVNLSEKKYFRDSLAFAIFSFILVYLTDLLFSSIHLVSFATTICYILWFIYCQNIVFKELKSASSEYLLLFSHSIIFYISANYVPVIYGISIYFAFILMLLVLERKNISSLIKMIK